MKLIRYACFIPHIAQYPQLLQNYKQVKNDSAMQTGLIVHNIMLKCFLFLGWFCILHP